MSRHYLIDGYNLIKQAPRLANLGLSDSRDALLRWVNATRPHGSLQNLITIVYDGNPAHFGGSGGDSVKIIFSDGQSADDFIKDVIDIARDKKKFVVVSNDKGIKLYVRAQGATVMSVKEFAPELFNRAQGGKGKKESNQVTTKYVSLTQTKKINDEFEKIWLK